MSSYFPLGSQASASQLRLEANSLPSFAPIIIQAALVFPLGRSGMMEASATQRFSKPRTFRSAPTTASASEPIRQVPTG